MNNAEWAARGEGATYKPKKISNLVSNESRLADLSGVSRQMPTEKPIAAAPATPAKPLNSNSLVKSPAAVIQAIKKQAADKNKTLQVSEPHGTFDFNGGQHIMTSNTRQSRYQFGKVLKKTISSVGERDKITKNILGNVGSNGRLYRKDVIRSLKGSGLGSHEVSRIMNHLGM